MNEQYLHKQIKENTERMEAARENGDFDRFTFYEREVENYQKMLKVVEAR